MKSRHIAHPVALYSNYYFSTSPFSMDKGMLDEYKKVKFMFLPSFIPYTSSKTYVNREEITNYSMHHSFDLESEKISYFIRTFFIPSIPFHFNISAFHEKKPESYKNTRDYGQNASVFSLGSRPRATLMGQKTSIKVKALNLFYATVDDTSSINSNFLHFTINCFL